MKKVLLIVTTLILVMSGIAAVSAFEGHMVDVRTHVENAMWMDNANEVDFGTTFPQEGIETDVWIGLSNSFIAQERYSTVRYELWWEPKLLADHPGAQNPQGGDYFMPIGPYIEMNIDGNDLDPADIPAPRVAAVQAIEPLAIPIGVGDLSQPVDLMDSIHMIFDPPVFDVAWNAATDPVTPSAVLVLDNNEYYLVWEHFEVPGSDDVIHVQVPMVDLGNNLKVQVIEIVVDLD